MAMNPGEKDLGSKKEEEDLEGFNTKFPKLPPSSSSRQWASTFKNPRIVRVSRTFGGKDRHSKVCTVRGLRDRRIRLSVPTAIQLYDLQERLGLTQPSKVIDWLLEASKQEIDKLPPLPMIPANFLQQPPSLLPFANPNLDPNPSIPYNVPEFLSPNMFKERERWGVGPHHDHQENHGEQNFFPLNNSSHHFSVPNLAYNPSFFHLEPQNLTLSQFGGGFSFSRSDDRESSNLSSSSRASSSQQVYMAESAAHFPPYFAPSLESDHFRQITNLQSHNSTLHFSDSPMKSFSLNASDTDLNSSPNPNDEGVHEDGEDVHEDEAVVEEEAVAGSEFDTMAKPVDERGSEGRRERPRRTLREPKKFDGFVAYH